MRYYIVRWCNFIERSYTILKKYFLLLLPVIFLFILYLSLPDFLIFNSLSSNYNSIRDTELQVAVYHQKNIDYLINEIAQEHNMINGTPTTLTIHFYHSKREFQNGYKPFYSISIDYSKKIGDCPNTGNLLLIQFNNSFPFATPSTTPFSQQITLCYDIL